MALRRLVLVFASLLACWALPALAQPNAPSIEVPGANVPRAVHDKSSSLSDVDYKLYWVSRPFPTDPAASTSTSLYQSAVSSLEPEPETSVTPSVAAASTEQQDALDDDLQAILSAHPSPGARSLSDPRERVDLSDEPYQSVINSPTAQPTSPVASAAGSQPSDSSSESDTTHPLSAGSAPQSPPATTSRLSSPPPVPATTTASGTGARDSPSVATGGFGTTGVSHSETRGRSSADPQTSTQREPS